MKYLSGTRSRKITYVVEPKRPMFDSTSGARWFSTPLYAEFKEHKFDSESEGMMNQYREYARAWNQAHPGSEITPEDVRKKVDKYLQNHPDWARTDGRGIFLDQTVTKVTSQAQLEESARARGVVPERRCLFMQDVGDDTVQCDQLIPHDSEGDYCSTHEAILEAAGASS